MKTLTEMLDNALNDAPPESVLEREANFYEIEAIKRTVKEWLRAVGLPNYLVPHKKLRLFNATESVRGLLITLVDEP